MRRLVSVLALLVLSGCGPIFPNEVVGDPADPDAQMRPDLIVAEPVRVGQGEILSLTFPEGTSRGLHFVLESQARGAWFHMFDLASDGGGQEGEPLSVPAGQSGFVIPAIGIGGKGPDHVVIPHDASPGTWRICTGNAVENICAQIEVVQR